MPGNSAALPRHNAPLIPDLCQLRLVVGRLSEILCGGDPRAVEHAGGTWDPEPIDDPVERWAVRAREVAMARPR